MEERISKIEKAHLLLMSTVLAILSLLNQLVVLNQPKPSASAGFEIFEMARASLFPWFRILMVFCPFFILQAKRYLIAAIYCLIALIPAFLEFSRNLGALPVDGYLYRELNSLSILWLVANPIDYLTFIFGNILLFWLVSCVLRSYIKNE